MSMIDRCLFTARSALETRNIGVSLAKSWYRPGGLLLLQGELGAGKTTFVQGFAEGLGIQAKTDQIDAKVLARTVELCAPNQPRSKEREQLGDISRTIECLKLERSGHLKRLQSPGFSKVAAKILERLAKNLNKQITLLQSEFEKQVAKTSLAERYGLAHYDGSAPQYLSIHNTLCNWHISTCACGWFG